MTTRRNGRVAKITTVLATSIALMAVPEPAGSTDSSKYSLAGRAVLPVETYAPGPEAGTFFGKTEINRVQFPLPSQPVQGFSAVIAGRRPGEYLAMPDNGFGGKANSSDFLIRAYYIEPDFKTATGGTGTVKVKDFIEFRDPKELIAFPIVNEGTTARLLTGGDIDPESLQRDHSGHYWMGDEFGPWILHFDAMGVLVDSPFALPGGLMSPNNPLLTGSATHPNSRGIEAMALTPDGRHLYAALEGPTVADDQSPRRHVFEFSTRDKQFTGRTWEYQAEHPSHMVADLWALDQQRFVAIERDGGRGSTALFRNVYLVDLRRLDGDGYLVKRLVVDLTKIPDPDKISLPAIHEGDLGLGNPFWVMCESVEAVYAMNGVRLLVACDNNFPNSGRNPGRADDNELIVVDIPGLKSRADDRPMLHRLDGR